MRHRPEPWSFHYVKHLASTTRDTQARQAVGSVPRMDSFSFGRTKQPVSSPAPVFVNDARSSAWPSRQIRSSPRVIWPPAVASTTAVSAGSPGSTLKGIRCSPSQAAR